MFTASFSATFRAVILPFTRITAHIKKATLMTDNIVNVTNNVSPWQIAATALTIVGAAFFVAKYIRIKLFEFLTDWQLSQLQMQKTIHDKQEELSKKVDDLATGQDNIQACIHDIPGHPENGK